MKVYGRELTKHYKKLIEDDCRNRLIEFLEWFHLSGIQTIPHSAWRPRYFKFPDGSMHSSRIVVAKFLSECQEQ